MPLTFYFQFQNPVYIVCDQLSQRVTPTGRLTKKKLTHFFQNYNKKKANSRYKKKANSEKQISRKVYSLRVIVKNIFQ